MKLKTKKKKEKMQLGDDDAPLIAPSAARKSLPPQSVDKNDAKQRAKESDAKKEKKEKKEKEDKKNTRNTKRTRKTKTRSSSHRL